MITEDDARKFWLSIGGTFHGPKIEHGLIEESKLLPVLMSMLEICTPHDLRVAADRLQHQLSKGPINKEFFNTQLGRPYTEKDK
jgi:hypothetical protein